MLDTCVSVVAVDIEDTVDVTVGMEETEGGAMEEEEAAASAVEEEVLECCI